MSISFTSVFGEHPDVRVVEFLAAHREFDYTITELSRNAGISRPAAYKVVARMLQRGILVRTRRVGASWFFRINAENRLVRPLLDLEMRVDANASTKRRRLPARASKGVRSS